MTEKGKRRLAEIVVGLRILLLVVVLLLVIGMNHTLADKANSSGVNEIMPLGSSTVKKVLYVASYSTSSDWGRGIKSGIESVLKTRDNVQLQIITMDTMGMTSADTDKKIKAALEAKLVIDSWHPDVVITSDDNAAKYLIVPYFKHGDLPFVFCGINWDASKYGFPLRNVTGMVEVQLMDQLVEYLSLYAKGNRIGSLRGDTMTNRGEAEYVEKQLAREVKTYFVDNITEWKERFVQLQDEVDMILVGDIDAVKFNPESKTDMEKFMVDHTEIPTGRWDAHYKNDALITLATIPEEQGEYAAQAALEILDGKSPMDMPLVKNKKAAVILNMKLAKKLGIIFPINLVEGAQIIPAD